MVKPWLSTLLWLNEKIVYKIIERGQFSGQICP